MKNGKDALAFITHLREQHETTHRLLQRIDDSWPVEEGFETAAGDPSMLVDAIDALRHSLACHFDQETEGGCLEEAVCICPSLAENAGQIERDQARLLTALDQLVTEIESPHGWSPETREAVRARFDNFVAQLHRHEDAEDHLLERAFGKTVGP